MTGKDPAALAFLAGSPRSPFRVFAFPFLSASTSQTSFETLYLILCNHNGAGASIFFETFQSINVIKHYKKFQNVLQPDQI